MAKTREQKEKIYSSYKETLDSYQTTVLLDMNAVKTPDVEVLKNKLAEVDSRYVLVKNTIFKKALEEHGKKIEKLEGSTGAVFAKEDPSEALKVLVDFINQNKVAAIRQGFIEKTEYTKDQIIEISKLPSKNELIAKVVGATKAPLYSFVNVLAGVQRNFLYTLKAIEQSK